MLGSADECIVPGKTDFRKVSEWIEMLQDPGSVVLKRLESIYGHDKDLTDSRRAMFLKSVVLFGKIFGTRREVVIARSPCRINLRGMHSEMQHATPNYLTHCREIVMVAGKRDDDLVVLNNVDSERFGLRQFRISEEMARGKWVQGDPLPITLQKRTVLEGTLKSPFGKGDLGGFSEKGAYVFKIPPDPPLRKGGVRLSALRKGGVKLSADGKWRASVPHCDWLEYIDSPGVRECVESARGDWANYVKASVLKLQDSFPEKVLKGMDVVAFGDAPRGCGMASSSAVVVSSGLAAMAINDLTMDRRELTVCLGRGEWYVGTRGGFGDHGALLFGRQGHILHSVFLTVEEMQPEYIPFPQDYQVIIVNSYKTSAKSAERLFAYNQTMFAYSMAITLIKDVLAGMGGYSREFLDQLSCLGQITPEAFGLQRIYEILRALPERITVNELKRRYSASEIDGRLDRFFGQLGRFPDSVEVRGAALWGIAESERSRAFARLIKEGRIREAGELMYIGHDGDRLFTFRESDEENHSGTEAQREHREPESQKARKPESHSLALRYSVSPCLSGCIYPIEFTENRVTDDYLDALVADLQSGEPIKVANAQLARQPGDFDASSLELDTIVEIARGTRGVVGASLTGAGFGGNVLAVSEKSEDVLTALKEALFRGYYEPQEQAELEWVREDRELEAAFRDDDELRQMRHELAEIVKRKREAKGGMSETDIEYAESAQRRINALFREGKIGRELLFIPANYYAEGVVVNVTVERAGVL